MDSFLTRTLARIRLATDEPSLDAKYTDAVLIGYIESAYGHVFADINRTSQRPIVARFDISVTSADDMYVLPPTVGSVLDLQHVDSSDRTIYHYRPSDARDPKWPYIQLEGNIIRFNSSPTASYTLRVLYLPTGCVRLHEGTAGTITNDTDAETCTVVLDATPSSGEVDLRPNAYVGSIFRVLTAATNSYVQERIISTYDVDDAGGNLITVVPNFTVALLPGAAVTYEIAPLFGDVLDTTLALWVSQFIVSIEGYEKRARLLALQYERAIRDVRLHEAHYDEIRKNAFHIIDTHVPGQTLNELEHLGGRGGMWR